MKPTQEQIRSEPAGRQADAWVLEYVFGCTLQSLTGDAECRVWVGRKGEGICQESEEPRFSTHPIPFHQMLAEMEKQEYDYELYKDTRTDNSEVVYSAKFHTLGRPCESNISIFEAGVRAALLAVMGEKKVRTD